MMSIFKTLRSQFKYMSVVWSYQAGREQCVDDRANKLAKRVKSVNSGR